MLGLAAEGAPPTRVALELTSLVRLRSAFSPSVLPVEMIERILLHAFIRPKPDAPSSDHYPLRNATHLLFVSKAFHQLALPFFLHSIIISRPKDWVTFFGAETGLFVGERGVRLWKHVQRISVVRAVYPPIRQPYNGEQRLLSRLTFPSGGRRIQHLTVLDSPDRRSWEDHESAEAWSRRPGAAEVYRYRTSDEVRPPVTSTWLRQGWVTQRSDFATHVGSVVRSDPYEARPSSAPNPSAMTERTRADDLLRRAVDDEIFSVLKNAVEGEQVEAVRALFVAVSPVALHDWDTDVLRFLPEAEDEPSNPPWPVARIDTFVVHKISASMIIGRRGLDRTAQDMQHLYGDLNRPHVHLVGSSASEIDLLVTAIREPWHRPQPEVKRWTWEAVETGQMYELDMTDL